MEADYTVCVKNSLKVLKNQRKKLCQMTQSEESAPQLYMGLYEKSKAIRVIYFQRVIVMWLDEHWSALEAELNRSGESDVDTKNETVVLFAKGFKNFLRKDIKYNSLLNEKNLRSILKTWKDNLDELIGISDSHEKNISKLVCLRKKHSVKFENMLKEQESEDSNE